MDAGRAVAMVRVRQRLGVRLAFAAPALVLSVVYAAQLTFLVPRLWAIRHALPLHVLLMLAAVLSLPLFMALLWMPFGELLDAVTRVVLTPTHLRVHRGLFATDVPLDAVTGVAVERTKGWFPAVPTLRGLARLDHVYQSFRTKESLRVEWLDAKGKTHRVWVYLDEAAALKERIGSLRAGSTGVRVDVDAADDGAAVDEADDDEVLAGEERARRRTG